MKFQTVHLKYLVVLILFFCLGIESFGQQEPPIHISPIQITWDAEAQQFDTYFDVTNDTTEDVDLTSIIIFKIGKRKRWRGSHLPDVKSHSTQTFKISFSPGLMLKNEYFSITVNIYGKNYVGLLDYSARYLNISSHRIIDKEGTKIELTETPPLSVDELKKLTSGKVEKEPEQAQEKVQEKKAEEKTEAATPVIGIKEPAEEKAPVGETGTISRLVDQNAKKTLIILGPAKEKVELLATEQFQNVELEKVSPEEKKKAIEQAGKKIVAPPEPPNPPENLAVTPGKFENRLSWDPVEDASTYNLYWGTSPGVTPENGQKIENVSSGYIHSGLKDDTAIYYVVTAVRDQIESAPSPESMGRPLAPPSEIPTLSVTPGKLQNRLTWKPVQGATTYNLYWGEKSGITPETGNRIQDVTSGYIHQNLTDDVPVYYILTAVRDGMEGKPSPEVSAKPLIPPGQAPVLTVSPEKFQNRLSWQPVAGVSTYHLYWSKSPGVTPQNGNRIDTVTNGFVHSGLEEPGPFYYVVTAEKDGFESAPSNEVTAKPILPPKNIPRLSIKVGDGSLGLSWTAIPGATAYDLYWGTTREFEPTADRKLVLQKTEFQHAPLQNEQTYFYRIAAVNQDGEGQLSPVVGGTPVRLEATVGELLEGVQLDDFKSIKTDSSLLVTIADVNQQQKASLKRAEELKELDISSRDKLISLFIAEGKSESVAKVLSGQLSKEPENLNLSLSLSKVYHEQGDIKAALKVLNSSLNRISLSARIALNQELKTSVRKGESTLTTKSEEAYLADEFSRLGISLLEKQKYEEALSAFQSLYSLSQNYPMVKYYLGQSRQGMKQFNQAKQLYVEQAGVDLKKKQLMEDLAALTTVLAVTLDIPTIKDTRNRYVTMQQGKNTPQESQTITRQIATLDALMAEAEKRRLAGLPDLAIAMADTFSRTALQPGQKIHFSFIATNHGKKQSEPFRVYYKLKHEQGIIFDIAGFDRFKALEAIKGKTDWEKEILVPDNVVPGKYQLIATLEQTGGKGEVTFDNNSAQSAPEITVIQPVPDLEIKFAKQLPAMPFETGQAIDLAVVVTNIGFKDSPPFEVDYFLESRDGDIVDLKVPDKQKSIKKGNRKSTWKKHLPINVKLKEGSYRIVAKIRMDKKAVEENADNNTVTTGYQLTYTPPFTDMSLAFAGELPSQSIIAGKSFSARLKVENKGNSDSSAGKITYRLLNKNGDEIDLEEESPFPALKKGQAAASISQKFTLPDNIKTGTYQLNARLELEDDDLERHPENNQAISAGSITIVSSFTDLALTLMTTAEEQPVKPGDRITVRAQLKNQGNRDLEGISVHYTLSNRSGDELEIESADQIPTLKAGVGQEIEKVIEIPSSLEEGIYKISAKAKIDNDKYEKNTANNAADSDYVFTYLKPKPVEPVVEAAEKQAPAEGMARETEEQQVTNWVRHAAAISLAVGGAWQAMAQDQKYRDAQDREDELQSQYSSSQSASEVSVIDSQLEDNRSRKNLYAQNTNMWTALALAGVSWEVYNIFFWEPDQTTPASGEGFQLKNKWAHASAVGIAAIAFWQSQSELKKYNDLSDENDSLKAQYNTAASAAEVAAIRNQISSNETEMENHINNANIFDGVTLAAVGFESYLLWKAFSDPDSDIVKLRYENMDGFQLKPWFAYEKVGLNLNYNW